MAVQTTRGARRAKKQTTRTTKSAELLVNQKYLGSKPPVYDGTESSVARALNWYRMIKDHSDARKAGVEFLRTFGLIKQASSFSKIPDKFVPESFCWQAHLYLDGWVVMRPRVDQIKDSLIKAIRAASEASSDTPRPMTGARAKALRVGRMIADIDEVLDRQDMTFSMVSYLSDNPITSEYVPDVISYYEEIMSEWTSAFEGSDADLKEAYSHITKKEWKSRLTILALILDELHKLVKTVTKPSPKPTVERKPRKPRAKKVIPASKKVANLKYLASCSSPNLKSVDPSKIVGASEVWLYNDKYQTLTRVMAASSSGLDIKGQSILNFDEKTSYQKRVGRKCQEMTAAVMNATKPQLKKVLDNVKSASTETKAKINNNVLILRVVP